MIKSKTLHGLSWVNVSYDTSTQPNTFLYNSEDVVMNENLLSVMIRRWNNGSSTSTASLAVALNKAATMLNRKMVETGTDFEINGKINPMIR